MSLYTPLFPVGLAETVKGFYTPYLHSESVQCHSRFLLRTVVLAVQETGVW